MHKGVIREGSKGDTRRYKGGTGMTWLCLLLVDKVLHMRGATGVTR